MTLEKWRGINKSEHKVSIRRRRGAGRGRRSAEGYAQERITFNIDNN
ncbi:MAG: hypothetical protein GXP63_01415 [DPANN group archaeon]|nr:hypothetical protein [DPANN group archaeon]